MNYNTYLGYILPALKKGQAGGTAELDGSGKVPSSQLPSYVDDILEFNGVVNFPATGQQGKIYVDTVTGFTYRWSGSQYIKLSSLKNLLDGSEDGSLRSIGSANEDSNYTIGSHATTLGFGTKAIGNYSFAEGFNTIATGYQSHAEGSGTKTIGSNSHAEGSETKALGINSHAEGIGTTASENYSHAEGAGTTASGLQSHAEGAGTTASGINSHAEGAGTTASGVSSHAEGSGTKALGINSHAEGIGTTASGGNSHTEGNMTTALGNNSHAEGNMTEANHRSQHVFGEYNQIDSSKATVNNKGTYIEIVGNGTSANNRSNARTLDWEGNESLAGNLTLAAGTNDEVTISANSFNNKVNKVDLSMIAPIESGTTASQGYTVGKYFLLNNQFCKAKTDIASGATFTLNTNYEVTTVADELYTALNA